MEVLFRLSVFLAVSATPSIVVLWRPSERNEQYARYFLAAVAIFVTASYNAYFLNPSNFRADESLPLQVCDLLGFASILALASGWRFPRSIIVLCAIPFVLQAVLTPVGVQQLGSLRTILYWAFHTVIFSTFIFEVSVRGFKLNAHDLGRMYLLDLAYVVLIGALNILTGWNYGYIGNVVPDTPTILDLLGPWPYRVVSMIAVAMLMQFLCYLAFRDRRGGADDL